ncbi:hypothetical protein MJO28_004483 [Puccinia striiformis f. sp. tritici]|uniref:Uncharacterized protein n=1 Tax=Puccinia striiformis f. sp. tritici TaxID=168172 RepID=A0ACC0EQS9_9BASI|nr:hypothetical protein MJO28_004483 [Puccinia striiformis f. sp. tritici]
MSWLSVVVDSSPMSPVLISLGPTFECYGHKIITLLYGTRVHVQPAKVRTSDLAFHAKDYGKKPWAKTSRWWSQQRRVLTAITASLMALTDFVGSIGLLYGFKGHIYPNTAKSKRSESG